MVGDASITLLWMANCSKFLIYEIWLHAVKFSLTIRVKTCALPTYLCHSCSTRCVWCTASGVLTSVTPVSSELHARKRFRYCDLLCVVLQWFTYYFYVSCAKFYVHRLVGLQYRGTGPSAHRWAYKLMKS